MSIHQRIEQEMAALNAGWNAAARAERTAQMWLTLHRWVLLPAMFVVGVVVGAWL